MPEDDSVVPNGELCVALDVNEEKNKTELVVLKCIDLANAEARYVFLPIGKLNCIMSPSPKRKR